MNKIIVGGLAALIGGIIALDTMAPEETSSFAGRVDKVTRSSDSQYVTASVYRPLYEPRDGIFAAWPDYLRVPLSHGLLQEGHVYEFWETRRGLFHRRIDAVQDFHRTTFDPPSVDEWYAQQHAPRERTP